MKRLTLCAILFVLASVLVADVCWGNGSPLYQGDYINYTSQIVMDDTTIYVIWTQKNQETHMLNMLKTDYLGNPLWTEPVTIDQSEAYIGGSIKEAADGYVFVKAYRDQTSDYMMYKLDTDGNIIWQQQFNYTISQVLALDDGGIICFSKNNPVHATWIATDGTVIWNDISLNQTNGSVGCAMAELINGKLCIVDQDTEYFRLLSYNQDGSLHHESPQYTFSTFGSLKYMNGNFYGFFEEGLHIKMWMLDSNGNSLIGADPLSLFGCSLHTRVACLDGDGGFSLVQEYPGDDVNLWMYDYDGTLLHSETYGNGNTLIRKACDQDVDFVSALYYEDDHEYGLILPISDDGFDDSIILHDFPASIISGMQYVQNGYTCLGVKNEGNRAMVTARIEDGTILVNNLYSNDNESIHPRLVKSDDGLNAYWYSASHDSLMLQQFNENGQPQHEENGTGILSGGENSYIDDQILFTIDVTDNAMNQNVLSVQAYNPDGSLLWTDPCTYTFDYYVMNEFQISPFYDGYILYGAGYGYDSNDLIMVKLMPSGPAWSEPLIQSMPYCVDALHIQSNTLFYHYDVLNKSICPISENGALGQPLSVNCYLEPHFYGDEYDTFAAYEVDGFIHVYYIHEGQLVWQTPLIIDGSSYDGMQISAINNGLAIATHEYNEMVYVTSYDLQKNTIPSMSFTYDALHNEIHDLRMICHDDAVVLCFAGREYGVETQFTYAVFAPDGTVLQPETAEPLMDRDYMARIQDIVFMDDSIYLALSCELYIGDYWEERDVYVQKVDVNSIVGASPHTAPPVQDGCTLQAYPNPFNPSTKISFSLPQDAHAEIALFNCRGQRVQTLLNDTYEAGSYSVDWTGRDAADKPVSSGVYFYQLKVNGHAELTKKAILLK